MLKQKRIENTDSIGIANFAGAGPFRVRHHAEYIPFLVADACNVVECTVRIGFWCYISIFITVPVNDLIVFKDGLDGSLIGLETTFAMGDGNFEGPVLLAYDMNIFANELLIGVFEQYTWEQTGLTKDLKSIADTQYFSATLGKSNGLLHHWAEPGNGSATEVVTIGESSWQHNAIFS